MAERNEKYKRGAKRISLTPAYRAIRAGAVIESADKLAERIAGSEPRPGSMVDIEEFSRFASKLRREVSIALISGGLKDLLLRLPQPPHLSKAIIKRTVGSGEARIPGISLLFTPNEAGWTGFFAGKNHLNRIRSNPTDQEKIFRGEILESWGVGVNK